jgi:hypothetical protein
MLCCYAECRILFTIMSNECHYADCHYADCYYADCHYADCHYAECGYAECRFADFNKSVQGGQLY